MPSVCVLLQFHLPCVGRRWEGSAYPTNHGWDLRRKGKVHQGSFSSATPDMVSVCVTWVRLIQPDTTPSVGAKLMVTVSVPAAVDSSKGDAPP